MNSTNSSEGGSTSSLKCNSPSERVSVLVSEITPSEFDSWYREREVERNIRNGRPYFNGPSRTPDPEQHSPSRLLKCHRRVYYQLHNAPAEIPDPEGIFWFGSQFETEVAVPFFQDLAEPDLYVRNSMWVDFSIDTGDGKLRFRGETDPVIVDEDSQPLLLTEIKTTSSFTYLDSPRAQHLAQAHAYLYGLSEESDQVVRDAILLYGKRDDFSLRTFHVRFDTAFWDEVLEWAEKNTHYRETRTLPPAQPEFEWECQYCPYRRRCGKTEDAYTDVGPVGLLPLVDDYPRERLEEYLAAYPSAKLTPTLAHRYPELADKHGSYEWRCVACGTEYPVDSVTWKGDTDHPPQCASCSTKEIFSPLAGPHPEKQAITSGDE